MATIKGRANIEKFLKENPNAGYKVVDAGGLNLKDRTPTAKSNGLIDDLATGLINPIRNFTTGTAEQSRQARRGENNAQYKTKFMSQDEYGQYQADAVSKNLQNIAGLASYAIPVGKAATLAGTIGKAALGGATSAGLSSFANQDLRKGFDINKIGSDALIGGAFGGALGAVSKGLSRGNKANTGTSGLFKKQRDRLAETLDNSATGKFTKYTPQDVTGSLVNDAGRAIRGPEAQQKLLQKVSKSGSGEQILKDVNTNFQKLRSELTKKFASNKTPVNGVQLVQETLNSGAGKIPGFNTALKDPDNALSIFLNDLKKAKSVSDLAKVYQKTQDYLGSNTFNKLNADKSVTELEDALLHLRNTIERPLKEIAKDAVPILDEMSLTHSVKKSLAQAVNKGDPAIKVPLLGVEVPGGGALNTGKRKVASVLRGEAPVVKLPQSTKVQRFAGNPMLNRLATNLIPQMTEAQPVQEPLDFGTGQAQFSLDDAFAQQNEVLGYRNEIAQQLMGLTDAKGKPIYNAQTALAEANARLQLQGVNVPNQAALSVADQGKVSMVKGAISDLNSIYNLFDTSTGLQSALGLPNFLRTSEGQQLESATRNVSDVIGRLRSGAAVTAQEEERFRSLLPSIGKSPETVKSDLQRLFAELSAVATR